MHTLSSSILAKRSIGLTITAAATNGTVVDCKGFERALIVFNSAPSGAGTTSDCKLQEGDAANLSDAADVTSATFAQVTTAGGAQIQVMDVDLRKRKRYVRLVHTGAGGSAAGAASGEVLLARGRRMAVAQDNTIVSV